MDKWTQNIDIVNQVNWEKSNIWVDLLVVECAWFEFNGTDGQTVWID